MDTLDQRTDPTDQALCAWHQGAHQRALNLLAGQTHTLAAQRKSYCGLGPSVHTLWAPRSPMTSYQRFHLHALRVHARAGFTVRVLDTGSRRVLERTSPLPTLVVYPNRGVIYLLHTSQGRPDGATRLREPGSATAAATQLDHLAADAVSLDLFARPHL